VYLRPLSQLVGAGRTPADELFGAREPGSPVDPKVLQPMFKGCKLLPLIHSVKGHPIERTVAVVCQKKPLYTLHSETDLRTLAFVEVHAPRAVTQDHIAQGDSLERLYALGQVDCDAGVDPAKRTILCTVVGHSAFGYQLEDTGHGPAGILPAPKALKALPITGLIWRASMI
jgi:hypothetical protein